MNPLLRYIFQAIRNTHVNIVDLIEWGRCGGDQGTVQLLKTKQELKEYTMETQKYFHKVHSRMMAREM
jgi:hypothetical protein